MTETTDAPRVPPDDETRRLIAEDGLASTLFVEAGAGTGKTTQLVDRIANLVTRQGVPLSQIAAITFTEAAAAELRARIRVRFEREMAEAKRASTDAGALTLQRCTDAIAALDVAAISTLHGFASRLLGEFAVAAELPPRVHVLDEVSSQLANEERWERFVDRLHADPAYEALLVRAFLLDVPLEPAYPRQTTFKDVAIELAQNWDRLDPILDQPVPTVGPLDLSPVHHAFEVVRELPAQCSDPDDKLLVALEDEIIPPVEAILAVGDPDLQLKALRHVAIKKVGRTGSKNNWPDITAARDAVTALREAIEAVVDRAVDEVLRALLRLVAEEVLRAARGRREQGGLEFHDLLVLARHLLRTDAEARQTLHQRYTHLLLDEFQDTDPIQIELAVLIAASIGDAEPGTWDELPVDDGRLFFVGDPKQSIYRFRRADIELFLAARNRFAPDDGWARLVTNFRTVEPIIAWVNALFSDLMPEELPGQQPRYEPLRAWRVGEPGGDHRPVLLGGPHGGDARAGMLREAEAEDVARAIDDIRSHPDRWRVHDDRTKEWRDARLSDVTILLPTRTSLSHLRSALDARDVPYRLATGTLVYDTQEVRDALAALRAIDDPTDQLSLVAALRSPLYACSDVDLYRFHQAGGRWNLRAPIPDAVPADQPVRVAIDHLRELWESRWWSSPSALLDRLLRERQAFVLAFGDPRHVEVWRRLRFLVDQARQFEESGGDGLRPFLEWAALQGAEGARVHEPMLAESDTDAVSIMTIHGSKGLEFPITILSGMTTKAGGQRRGVSVLWGPEGPPELKIRKGQATSGHDPWADIEEEMDAHEKLRLLYVAATRARDHLLVSCHHKEIAPEKEPDTYAARVWAFFDEHRDLWRELPEAPEAEAAPAAAASAAPTSASGPSLDAAALLREREEWLAERAQLVERSTAATVVSGSSIASLIEQPAAAPPADDVDADVEEADEPSVARHRSRGRAGSAIGRATHATLQLLDLADPRDLDGQVRRQCEVEAIPEHVNVVAAMVRAALASPTIQEAARSRHHKELYVAAPVGDRLLEGFVDLLIETPEGLVIVDYKTDTVRDEAEIDAQLAHHQLQGAAYALALQSSTGRPVVDCRFVFCRSSGAIERSVPDLRAQMERVAAALAA